MIRVLSIRRINNMSGFKLELLHMKCMSISTKLSSRDFLI
jgi:hypothetical protein